jgi:AIG2-like family
MSINLKFSSKQTKNSDMSDFSIWYFAYGINMNPAVLSSRQVYPHCSIVATVPMMRLAFEMVSLYRPGTGDATIRPLLDSEATIPEIWGILHYLPISVLDNHLDRWEAVEAGHYQRRQLEVITIDKCKLSAVTYEALHLDPTLKPDPEYLDRIVSGAESFRLPEHYLQFLRDYCTC